MVFFQIAVFDSKLLCHFAPNKGVTQTQTVAQVWNVGKMAHLLEIVVDRADLCCQNWKNIIL